MKLFKKLILALLLVAFTTTTALGFTDLHTNWHKDIVPWGVEQNIAKGFPDGTFKPDNAVTEAQFLALLLRKYDKTLTDNVNKSEWYNPYYVVAKNNNYPVSETPDSVILRTKVAEILAGTQGVNLAGDEAIAFLLARGLAKGKKKDEVSIENYYGQEGLTRAEALQFIRKINIVFIYYSFRITSYLLIINKKAAEELFLIIIAQNAVVDKAQVRHQTSTYTILGNHINA
jgi:hypothetical protein